MNTTFKLFVFRRMKTTQRFLDAFMCRNSEEDLDTFIRLKGS